MTREVEVGERNEDKAWVSVDSSASMGEARRVCSSIERLFRMNPYLEIASWQQEGGESCRVSLRNLSNGQTHALIFRVSYPTDNCILLRYESGLKRATRIELEPLDHGSRITITDDYGGATLAERRARASEVDRSLTAWGHSLRGYLERERRFGRRAVWPWFLDRVWLKMTPAGRRVCIIISLLSLGELALIVFVAAIYWIES